jgi:hypothetical protein
LRIATRTSRSLIEQRREKSLRNRAAAGTIAAAFPAVESVRIQLQLESTTTPVPAAQIHALYPSAPAYFDFSCPYGDCDGSLDLNGAVVALLEEAGSRTTGKVRCSGTRIAAELKREPCGLSASYLVTAQYQAAGKPGG